MNEQEEQAIREHYASVSHEVLLEEAIDLRNQYDVVAAAADNFHRTVHVFADVANESFAVIQNVMEDAHHTAGELRAVKGKKRKLKALKRISKALDGMGDTLDLYLGVKQIELRDYT